MRIHTYVVWNIECINIGKIFEVLRKFSLSFSFGLVYFIFKCIVADYTDDISSLLNLKGDLNLPHPLLEKSDCIVVEMIPGSFGII